MFSQLSHMTPCPPKHPQRPRHGCCPWVLAALLSCSLGGQSAALVQAEEPADHTVFRDVYHTMLARNALLKDNSLAGLNLGVRVQDRVATLWGPVPSAAAMRRAVTVLRQLPDLLDVRNDMHIEEQDGLRPEYLPERLPPGPPLVLPERLPPAVAPPPPSLPGLSREDGARGVLTKRPANIGEPLTAADNVRFRPALPPGFPTPNGEDENEPVLPSIVVPQSTPAPPTWSSLQLAVNSLRFADPRFQDLQAEAQGERVLLSGSAICWNDVRDFAAGLRRLPGVERVILGQVRTER